MKPSRPGLRYCRGSLKRCFDLLAAGWALLILSPLLLLVALLVMISSGRPILFRQERAGLEGRPFRILKFRTMRADAPGLPITGSDDRRVTPVGRWLRAAKLDELPQLINVLRGEMSVVGPRPELPQYVADYTPSEREVLEVRPGLTDTATLVFRDEERLLGAVPSDRRERFYRGTILPLKLDLNRMYIDRAGFWRDLTIIMKTLLAIFVRGR